MMVWVGKLIGFNLFDFKKCFWVLDFGWFVFYEDI